MTQDMYTFFTILDQILNFSRHTNGALNYSEMALDIRNKWKSSLHGTTPVSVQNSLVFDYSFQGSGLLVSCGLFIVFHYIIDTVHQCSECIVNK